MQLYFLSNCSSKGSAYFRIMQIFSQKSYAICKVLVFKELERNLT